MYVSTTSYLRGSCLSFRMKGTKNGGILENASYFIFSKRPDGLFEATPVEEWFSFKPTISYKNLNAEEAEEEFAKYDVFLPAFIEILLSCDAFAV